MSFSSSSKQVSLLKLSTMFAAAWLPSRTNVFIHCPRSHISSRRPNAISHTFVVEFASAADRDYYVRNDPVHQEFTQSVSGVLEKAQVIDFTNGTFEK
ncbi:hypothetical protein N7478_011598 [Penicillium angulare]|uniref:uncharacterized protein n=1 Tax=Penicillium angulare TaxID=116970 RepID=UPI00254013B8|nr:uncharacterized protein N7478_011598 [Penicillium angulare]KAJ5261003.1 hypothetical protein N7478_011598 [Penicillium angulare]